MFFLYDTKWADPVTVVSLNNWLSYGLFSLAVVFVSVQGRKELHDNTLSAYFTQADNQCFGRKTNLSLQEKEVPKKCLIYSSETIYPHILDVFKYFLFVVILEDLQNVLNENKSSISLARLSFFFLFYVFRLTVFTGRLPRPEWLAVVMATLATSKSRAICPGLRLSRTSKEINKTYFPEKI